jgi:hypothetical protein
MSIDLSSRRSKIIDPGNTQNFHYSFTKRNFPFARDKSSSQNQKLKELQMNIFNAIHTPTKIYQTPKIRAQNAQARGGVSNQPTNIEKKFKLNRTKIKSNISNADIEIDIDMSSCFQMPQHQQKKMIENQVDSLGLQFFGGTPTNNSKCEINVEDLSDCESNNGDDISIADANDDLEIERQLDLGGGTKNILEFQMDDINVRPSRISGNNFGDLQLNFEEKIESVAQNIIQERAKTNKCREFNDFNNKNYNLSCLVLKENQSRPGRIRTVLDSDSENLSTKNIEIRP